jgi:hypothetical protein
LSNFIKALIFGAFFLFGTAKANNPQIYQQRFEEGVQAMGANPNLAAQIFGDLYQETNAVRVQLEWARSLYLAGRLAEAKTQFIDILNKPESIPITVRDKVEWYVSEIQKQQSFKFTFSAFQDSNPGYVTSTKTVSIMGQTLSYQPAQPAQTETALNIGIQAEREIGEGAGYFAQLGANTLTYQTSAYNKQIYDASISKRWQDYDYKDLKLGYETMYYGGYTYYNYPYASTRFVFNGLNQDFYGFNLKGGAINYPTYTYLSGTQALTSAFYNHNITRNLSAYAEVGIDRTTATQQAYSSYGMYATIGTQLSHDATNVQTTLKASALQRNYWESDPLWGQVRQDAGRLYFFSITKRDFYVLGLRPSIDITYQNNNSSIPFFSYSKTIGGISFTNVY